MSNKLLKKINKENTYIYTDILIYPYSQTRGYIYIYIQHIIIPSTYFHLITDKKNNEYALYTY